MPAPTARVEQSIASLAVTVKVISFSEEVAAVAASVAVGARVSTCKVTVAEAAFGFAARSVITPAATLIAALPSKLLVGVNSAV